MEEFQLLETLLSNIDKKYISSPDGPGDDCAVIKGGSDILVSHDVLVEGVHFNLSWSSAKDVAWKCLASNESDIASMGGIPIGYTIGLILPSQYLNFAKDFYLGLNEYFVAAERRGYFQKLLGGDMSAGSTLSISIAVLGRVNNRAIRRSGATPGEILVVSEEIGLAGIGLELLRNNHSPCPPELKDAAILKHKRPDARTDLGVYLSTKGMASAMIDLSDGLFQDAAHIAKASNVSLDINLSEMSYPDYVNCGDDYELLFAMPNLKEYFLLKERYPNIKKIGLVTEKNEHAIHILDPAGRLDLDTYLKQIGKAYPSGFQHHF